MWQMAIGHALNMKCALINFKTHIAEHFSIRNLKMISLVYKHLMLDVKIVLVLWTPCAFDEEL